MDRQQSESDSSHHRGWGSFSILLTSTLLSGLLVMSKVKEEAINNLQQGEPIETTGPDMPIYTKTKKGLLHLLGKGTDTDKPQVIASSEDK